MIDVRGYLAEKGWQYEDVQRARGPEAVMNCPLCADKEQKFAINLNTGAWQCLHLNTCGEKGSLRRLQELLGDTPTSYDLDRKLKHPKPKVTYQRPVEPETKKLSKEAREYLTGRGFDADIIDTFGLYSPKPDVIAFPYRKDGVLVGVKYRSLDKKFWNEKGTEPVLFNRDVVEPPEVVLVEGELDAMAMDQYGVRAVSVPNGTGDSRWIEEEWEFLEPYTKAYICTDTDEAGETAATTIAKRLGEWRCWRVRLPYKDAADCLAAKVPQEEVLEAMASAEPYDLPALKQPRDFAAEVEEFLLNPDARDGISTGLRSLDYMLKGWRPGEVTVWSGRNSSGKTTILGQAILHIMQEHRQRVCISSLEMRAAHSLGWMVRQSGATMDRESIARHVDALNGLLYIHDHVGILEPEAMLEVWTYAARRYGVAHFVCDSLMRIRLKGSDIYAAQGEFVNELASFAQEHQAHIHLVAHSRKGATDDETPGKMDVSGSGDLTNVAHNVLVHWRPSAELREKMDANGKHFDAVLYLKKNRMHGFEGKIRLEFDGNKKRYSEVIAR